MRALPPKLARFLEDGKVTVGIVDPVGSVNTAADEQISIAMLVEPKNETLTHLLTGFDHAIASPSPKTSSPKKSTSAQGH